MLHYLPAAEIKSAACYTQGTYCRVEENNLRSGVKVKSYTVIFSFIKLPFNLTGWNLRLNTHI